MKKYNLIVVGGGLTGVAASVCAAREGLSVLLIEQSGNLGGAMSTNLVYPFMRFWTEPAGQERKYLSTGIFSEMLHRASEYVSESSIRDFAPEHYKFLLDDMIEEAGVDVLFHAMLYRVNTDGRKVTSVDLATKAGPMAFEADFFIDATGDGDLMAFAGCEFQLGREADGLCQPMTTCFRVAGVDNALLDKDERIRIKEIYKQDKEAGKIQNPREDVLLFQGPALGNGIVHFNTTRIVKLDPTDPFAVSRAEIAARKQIRELMAFLKEHDFPAFRNAYLVNIASSIGVRESRKLKGEHILTADELIACTMFDDAVALGNYDIDIHNPEGAGTSHRYFAPGEYYSIPYRSFLPKEFDNLLVGGRCLSATHEAQASVRIMPICATMGQAVGTAVAVAHKSGANTHTVDIKAVQKILRDNGAAID